MVGLLKTSLVSWTSLTPFNNKTKNQLKLMSYNVTLGAVDVFNGVRHTIEGSAANVIQQLQQKLL